MAEVATNIESRVTYQELDRILESKVSSNDFHFALRDKVNYSDVKSVLEQADRSDKPAYLEQELSKLHHRLDEIKRESSARKTSLT